MNGRKGVYSWENEPAGDRRSEFKSSHESDWRHSTQSTFAEPSRLDHRRRRRSAQQGLSRGAVVLIVAASLALAALGGLAAWWPALGRFLGR
ncbi:hypothetical protein HLB44_04255 [Aquincola sp. S2]|uniref:Uncharacterized protein n=1 Tax=Pseudaquabacterium terrae TaxID=2732868 RepID=A0ABX2EBB9_9BURK|nr:hypothetical protein [Aquabacterium terrae]NRF66188.1 hypothetical protein [Aquabacterium terrae]